MFGAESGCQLIRVQICDLRGDPLHGKGTAIRGGRAALDHARWWLGRGGCTVRFARAGRFNGPAAPSFGSRLHRHGERIGRIPRRSR
jgi:hypothetical protein